MRAPVEEQLQRAVDWHRRGNLARAEAAYRELLQEEPRQPDALHLLGVVLTQTGQAASGAECMQRSLDVRPDQPIVHANLGNALAALGEHAAALAAYEKALGSLPSYAPALNGRGNVLSRLGSWQEAIASYRRALALSPDLVESHTNLGLALAQLGQCKEALGCYERALALAPHHVSALVGQGSACLVLGHYEAAVRAFSQALRLQPDQPQTLFLYGRALMQAGRPTEATACFRRVHELQPNYDYVLGARLWAELHACSWNGHGELTAQIEEGVARGSAAAFPFVFLSVCDSPQLQLRCARRFAAATRPDVQPLWRGERYRHDRIRVAYISEDFRSHPTAYLMMGLWERHDRHRFETIAISLRPEEDSAVGRRIGSAFECFIDGSRLGDAELAQCMRDKEVDIAVDLMGYTGGNLRSLLARRPAPVQVNYLGYPGTLGSPDVDYLIADEFLIPESEQAHFAEQIVYLPGTYQPNDDRRATIDAAPSRAEAGLPEQAFVWCSFNNGYKLNPVILDVWCKLLRAVPHSVLWLIPGTKEGEGNLRTELAARHIDPARLIAATNLPNPDHVARIALADVCLDTSPVNGATTTSDALWAGVPVVTRAGRSFVSRMAGSLLTGVGLPELIATSWREYEDMALALAIEPGRLAGLRSKLAGTKRSSALFDTDRYRQHLETAFIEMWQRHERGEPPLSFKVA